MKYNRLGYLIGEGFSNVFKNKKSTGASLMIMCATMIIFGIFLILGENINHFVKEIESAQGIQVFIKNEATQEQIEELADAGKKKYKYFSLGMKQRLGIAAAIMEHPDIILIDEPTNALDSKGVEMVKCILQQEKERGALIVLTCHDYSVLKELSDSIYFIEEGRVVGYERQ